MEKWKQLHNLQIALKSELQLYADTLFEIESDKRIEDVANSKYMFSDVIYNDELDNSFKLNLSSNRSYKVMFFECFMLDGTVEYHSGESMEKILHLFPNINSLRQIKQEDYSLLKEKQSHLY